MLCADCLCNLGGFAFFRRKDLYGSGIVDLFRCEKCSVADLASMCLRIPQCGGFNTNGYLKYLPSEPKKEQMQTWPEADLDPCAGSYLRTACAHLLANPCMLTTTLWLDSGQLKHNTRAPIYLQTRP